MVDKNISVVVSSAVESERPVLKTEEFPAEVDSSSFVFHPFSAVNSASLEVVGKAQYICFFLNGHSLGCSKYWGGVDVWQRFETVPVQFYFNPPIFVLFSLSLWNNLR